ncbi:MAG: hypothetical protein ABIO05_08900 [Ferruginibacter sp.]
MKFIVSLLLIALLSFAACLYFPWWCIALVSFVILLLIPQRPGAAFICGFLSLFLLWGVLSFWLSYQNGHLLAQKMAMVILKISNPYLLILVTAVIGGVVAAFAALCASLLRYVPQQPAQTV